MAGAPQGGGGQAEGHMGAIWITALIFAIVGFLWIWGHEYIVAGVFAIKRVEVAVIQFFVDQLTPTKIYLDSTVSYRDVTFAQMATVVADVAYYFRLPAAIATVLLALLLLAKNPISQFCRTYDMRSLLQAEVENWPQEMPVLNLNLVKTPLGEGPWAAAMNPMTFAKKNKLLKINQVVDERSLLKKTHLEVNVLRDRAARVFANQMGQPWAGVSKLNAHTKALFAIFVAKLCHDGTSAQQLLRQISFSVKDGVLNFAGANELLAKHADNKTVKKIIRQHHYVLTVMASLLQAARSDGVLPTVDFLWLKPLDRSLWFMLNSVGRQTAVAETAGPFAHWLAEKELGQRIKSPMIEEAINALDIALKEIEYDKEN